MRARPHARMPLGLARFQIARHGKDSFSRCAEKAVHGLIDAPMNLGGGGTRGQSEIEGIDAACLEQARETPKRRFCFA